MSDQKITLTIDPMGNPKIEAFGFTGGKCANATEAIEKALAGTGKPMTRELKPEWHESEGAGNEVQQHQTW